MHRKLHNSLVAMTASTACLAAALMLGKPVQSTQPLHHVVATQVKQTSRMASHATNASASQQNTAKRSIAVSLELPFFSFLPRG